MGAAERLSSYQISERLDELPTLPTIVYELSRVINDPMSSTSDIELIMGGDQSMTTKVLKLANSAYYAIPGGVANLQRAIAYIGYDAIHQLVLSASIIKALDAKGSAQFEIAPFWKHCLGAAMAAETVARFVHHKTPADLFTCGLVHDMGKIALHIIAPEQWSEVLTMAKAQNITITEAEDRIGGARHTQIGRDLAVKWRLPAMFHAATAHHHQKDMASRGGLSPEMNQVVDIVFLSNLLINALQFGNSGHSKIVGVPKEVLERLHLSPEKLKELIGNVKQSITNADNFLKIIGG